MAKVFVVSIPKSGTYLWSNILDQLGYTFCGKHIWTLGYQQIPEDRNDFFECAEKYYIESDLADSLSQIQDGEYSVGHLPCDPQTIELLKDFKLIFSYRDLRECIVSYINYGSKFKRNKGKIWANESLLFEDRLNDFFRSDIEIFIKLINGVSDWKNINNQNLLSIAYEDLINCDPIINKKISTFFDTGEQENQSLIKSAIESPSFTKSKTTQRLNEVWSSNAETFFQHYGLDQLNFILGYHHQHQQQQKQVTKKVAIICNPNTIHYQYVHEYLTAFDKFNNGYEVNYISVPMMAESSEEYDFTGYDLVVVTFHIRPWLKGWGNPKFESALFRYHGPKVLLLHDEYDETENLKNWIKDYQVNHVFSVIPEQYLEIIYPPEQFPGCTFYSALTSYVPANLPDEKSIPPIGVRSLDVVYRGRRANPWHGELPLEKQQIGEYFKSLNEAGLLMDLESAENERIYGRNWLTFLMSARATLGTESGSNVFDIHGKIKDWFRDNEGTAAEQIPVTLDFKEGNLGVKMNQISPKIFESIYCKTVMILYEGQYSGVIKPGTHYIELKKDHSNIDQVLSQLRDVRFLQNMADKAYNDVIKSNKYSYEPHINKIFSCVTDNDSKNESLDVYKPGLSFQELMTNELAKNCELVKHSNKRTRAQKNRINKLTLANDNLKNRLDKQKSNVVKTRQRIDVLKNQNQHLRALNTQQAEKLEELRNLKLVRLNKYLRGLLSK